jgi:hypothetical protein
MRSIDYSTILFQAMQLCGLDRSDFNEYTFSQLRDMASARLRVIWEYDRWPELIKIEKVNTTEVDGAVFFNIPDSYGEIFAVYTADPSATTRGLLVGFDIQPTSSGNKCVLSRKLSEVWVEYRSQPPQLFGDLYNSMVTYEPGSQMYFDSGSNEGVYFPKPGNSYNGNFWVCKVQSTDQPPHLNPQNWEKIKIPYIFGNYLARAINSDYYRSEGMQELATQAEEEATAMLFLEIDKIARQQGISRKINFINPY